MWKLSKAEQYSWIEHLKMENMYNNNNMWIRKHAKSHGEKIKLVFSEKEFFVYIQKLLQQAKEELTQLIMLPSYL